MNFPFFIASKVFTDRSGKRKVSRPAIRIATIGVAIGLAVMIVTTAWCWASSTPSETR